jgi:hypothetical protein
MSGRKVGTSGEFQRSGAVLDSPAISLYNAPLVTSRRFRWGLGAQVAQLVEHAIENRSVGGSIPPLGTILPFIDIRRCQ